MYFSLHFGPYTFFRGSVCQQLYWIRSQAGAAAHSLFTVDLTAKFVVDEPDTVPLAGGGGGVVADPQVGEVSREVERSGPM